MDKRAERLTGREVVTFTFNRTLGENHSGAGNEGVFLLDDAKELSGRHEAGSSTRSLLL